MNEPEERPWKDPPAPGEVRDGRYVIPSPDDHYGPWVIEPTKPRKRDFWKVLRGKWKPEVRVKQTLTLKGTNRILKWVYRGEKMQALFHGPNPLLDMLEGKSGVVPIVKR